MRYAKPTMLWGLLLLTGWNARSLFEKRTVAAAAPLQASSVDNDLTGTATYGRFQIFHVYYSTAQQGTGVIDSQTGRIWLMKVYKDKDGQQDDAFFEEQKFPVVPKQP